MAERQFSFDSMFDDKKPPGAEMYPVMQTMFETPAFSDWLRTGRIWA